VTINEALSILGALVLRSKTECLNALNMSLAWNDQLSVTLPLGGVLKEDVCFS
jgi:hypothetical protein